MEDTAEQRFGPPMAPLAFRLGIVGHRPERMGTAELPQLKMLISQMLGMVKGSVEQIGLDQGKVYAKSHPLLRAISPLAEGVDRLFAEQAIALGYELSCTMPFLQKEYEKYFSSESSQETNSLERFRKILEAAEKETRLVRFELNGDRSDEGEAFRNNAQIVLNQSDLLFVVWDGIDKDKPGGTEETLYSAVEQQIPLIWIDACSPHNWQIIRPGQLSFGKSEKKRHIPVADKELSEVGILVREILAVPSGSGKEMTDSDQAKWLLEFYREKQPRWSFAFLWKFFRNLTGATRITFFSPWIKQFETSADPDKMPDSSTLSGLDGWLNPFYDWPDQLAENYADKYRSGFILTYLLASLAVGSALFPLIAGWLSSAHHSGLIICTTIESLIILTILGVVLLTRKRRWHGRWLDYRMMAESVRQLKLFLPLGGGKPFPKMAGHLTQYGNPSATWMTWYVQAVERMAGLPSLKVDNKHLKDCLLMNEALLVEQKEYHRLNAQLYARIDKRLHHTGELTLWLTLVACLTHLLPVMIPDLKMTQEFEDGLTFLCGFLPALGASMAGIHHQGEFKRIAKSSAAMFEQFSQMQKDNHMLLNKLSDRGLSEDKPVFNQITIIARNIANLMINEMSDWKVVYQDRPPTLPA
jgi:hypothetical protein